MRKEEKTRRQQRIEEYMATSAADVQAALKGKLSEQLHDIGLRFSDVFPQSCVTRSGDDAHIVLRRVQRGGNATQSVTVERRSVRPCLAVLLCLRGIAASRTWQHTETDSDPVRLFLPSRFLILPNICAKIRLMCTQSYMLKGSTINKY